MINYDKHRDDKDFMDILDYIRHDCICTQDEICENLQIHPRIIRRYFRFAQSIVIEEIENGIIHDPLGAYIAHRYMDYLLGQKGK